LYHRLNNAKFTSGCFSRLLKRFPQVILREPFEQNVKKARKKGQKNTAELFSGYF
jgi:hypothetical protein